MFGDNIIVTANGDYTIDVWNTDNKEKIKTIHKKDSESALYSILQIDRVGTLITGSSSGDIVACDYMKEDEIKTFTEEGGSGAVNDLHMISVGNIFCSASYNGSVRIWNYESGRCSSTYVHSGKCICLYFVNSARWLFAGSVETPMVRAWDIEKGEEVVRIHDHLRECSCIWGEHERNLVITGSKDHSFKLWDIRNLGLSRNKFMESVKMKQSIYACYMSQTRPYLYIGDLQGEIFKFDIRKLNDDKDDNDEQGKLDSWKPHTKCIWRIKPISPNKFVSCSDDSSIFVWDHEGKEHAKMVSSSYVYGVCGKYKEVFDRLRVIQMQTDDRERRGWLMERKGEYFSFLISSFTRTSSVALIHVSKSFLLL